MLVFHKDNSLATQERIDVAIEKLGREKWNALDVDDKAGALAYIEHHQRYNDDSFDLEGFIDSRFFYAFNRVDNITDCAEELWEENEPWVSEVFTHDEYIEGYQQNWWAYYVELYDETRDDTYNDFCGMVFWKMYP